MREPWIWSVSLGRWWNVHVRMHMFFLLFAVFGLYLTYLTSTSDLNVTASTGGEYLQPWWWGISCVITLLISVILHEAGHLAVARHLGGSGDEMVIGPLGGLNAVRVPFEPQSELVALMAGTLVNALICLLAALVLAVTRSPADLVLLLNPMSTEQLVDGAPLVVLCKTIFWINWLLILVNFLPCFPFDGGRSLRSALMFFWPDLDAYQSVVIVARLGRVVAVVLLVVAYFTSSEVQQYAGAVVPPWFALTMLSVFVFFSAKREEQQLIEDEAEEDSVFGYDFSQGYTSLERSVEQEHARKPAGPRPVSALTRWLQRRRLERQRMQREREMEDEKRVDQILTKLHEGGMHSLSQEEQQLLNRVSKRYRSRQG